MANDNKFRVKSGVWTNDIKFVSPDGTKIINATMSDTDAIIFTDSSYQLLSISGDPDSSLLQINDTSGVAMLTVTPTGDVKVGEYAGKLLVGQSSASGSNIVQVTGGVSVDTLTTSGNLVVGGNLQVDGTTTTINSTELTVDDINITLGHGAINAAAVNGAGLTIDTVSATLTYTNSDDRWNMNKGLHVTSGTTDFDGTVNLNGTVNFDPNGNPFIIDSDGARDNFYWKRNGVTHFYMVHDSSGHLNMVQNSTGEFQIDGNRILTTADSSSFLSSSGTDSTSGNLFVGGILTVGTTSAIYGAYDLEISDTALFDANSEGFLYTPQEGGAFSNPRYFLRFNSTDDASYPFLTNRTPSGDVRIFTGAAAGGSENEIVRFEGGDGTRNVVFSNANVGIGTTNPAALLESYGSRGSNWAGRFENTSANGYGILGITAGTDAADKIFELRKGTSTTVLQVDGNGDIDFMGADGGTNGLGNLQRISSAYFVNNEDDNISTTLSQTNGARLYYDHNFYSDQTRFSNVFSGDGGGFAYYGGDQFNWTAIYDTENTQYAEGTWRRLNISAGTSTDRALVISHSLNDPENEDFQFSVEITTTTSGSGALTSDRERGAIWIDLNDSTTGGDTSNEARLYGMYVDIDSSGDPDLMVGVQANVTSNMNSASDTITNVWGMYGLAEADQASGTINSLVGMYGAASVDNAGSSATSGWGGRFIVTQANDGGTITNAYGVEGELTLANTTSGSFTTGYAVKALVDNNSSRADAIGTSYLFHGDYQGTLPTNARGIWIPDSVPNHFNGDVGIGTATANARLHVREGQMVGSDPVVKVDALYQTDSSYNGHGSIMQLTTDRGDGFSDGYLLDARNADGPGLYVRGDRKVGIGTDNPAVDLHIGDGSASPYIVIDKSTSGTSGIILRNAGNNKVKLEMDDAEHFRLSVNNDEKMAVLENGNVGIGTNTPEARLHIESTIVNASAPDFPVLIAQVDYSNAVNQLGGSGVGIQFNPATNSADAVGGAIAAINTSSSDDVTTTDLAFYTSNDDATLDERLRIESTGAVGIGTNNPAHSLDVNGVIHTRQHFQKEYNGQEILIKAADSGGDYSIYHTINDGQGNYNIMLGVNGAAQHTTNDGAAKLYFTGHGTAGYLSMNASNTGTAGNTVTYTVGLGVDSASNAIYVGNPNDSVGLDSTGEGFKIADNTGRIFGSDILGNQTYTSAGQIALARSNNNPYLSFHSANGSRNGYIQSVPGTAMTIQNDSNGAFLLTGGTTVSDPPRLLITAPNQSTTAPGDMYGQIQFKVNSSAGMTASGLTGTDANTIAMIAAQDFRNGSGKTNEDSGLGFYTTESGGTLEYRGGISNLGKWFVGNWNNDNNGDGSKLNVNGDSYFDGKITTTNDIKTDGIAVDSVIHYEDWNAGNNTVASQRMGTWTFSGGTFATASSAASDYPKVDKTNYKGGTNAMTWVGAGTSILTSPSVDMRKYTAYASGNEYAGDSTTTAYSDAKIFLTCHMASQSMDASSEYFVLEVYDGSSWIELAKLSEDNDPTQVINDTTWYKITVDVTEYCSHSAFQWRFKGTGTGGGDGYGVGACYLHQATMPAKLSLRTLEINETSSVNALNVSGVFKFNPSTDLFTITNNQNTGGINIDGNNGRLYFNGIRALEANTSGYMTIGEGMNTTNFASGDVGIGTASPAVKLDVVGTIRSQAGEPRLVLHDTSNSYGGGSVHHIDFSTTGGNMGYIGVSSTSEGTIEISNDSSHPRIVDNTGTYNDIKIVPSGTMRVGRNYAHSRYLSQSGIVETPLQIQTNYDSAGSQNIKFSRLDGNWLDGATGADTQYGMVFSYQNSVRGGLIYDHRSTERMTMWSSYGRFGFLMPGTTDSNAVPTDSNMTEVFTIDINGDVGIGTTDPTGKIDIHGTEGQLFVVTDSMTGTIFSVNDSSGVPNIEVFDTGQVNLAEYAGNVLVGTNTDDGSNKLQVNGGIMATADVTAYASSDSRLKTDLQPIDSALNKVDSLTGYTFSWNETAQLTYGKDTDQREAGIIAQEVDAILPEVTTTRDDGYMAVKYEKMVPLLIEAIKELKQTHSDEIAALKAEIEELKRK